MEEYITVTAKTVKDAILEASLKLETFRDNIEYEVIEEGSTGFLGFGSKKAIIKARKKVAVEDILKEEVKEEKPAKKEKREFKKEKKEFKENKKEFKKEKKERPERKEFCQEEPVAVKEETTVAAEPAAEPVQEAPVEVKKERKVVPLTPEEKEEAKEKALSLYEDEEPEFLIDKLMHKVCDCESPGFGSDSPCITPLKTKFNRKLSDDEFNGLNKIASSTKMDCWFYIKQNKKGQDYVFDIENGKRLSLKCGIKQLIDGVIDTDIFELSDDEKFILIALLGKLV